MIDILVKSEVVTVNNQLLYFNYLQVMRDMIR